MQSLLPSTSGRQLLEPQSAPHVALRSWIVTNCAFKSSPKLSKARWSTRPPRLRHQLHLTKSRCQGNSDLEQTIQQGLEEQEQRDEETTKRAQDYKRLNEQIESLAEEVKDGLQGTSIYLVGMMGSGKSTVGKLVARALEYPFLDSDQIAEAHADTTIARIFEAEGEEAFRDLESAVLQELMPFRSCVVATGGGAVTRRKNWGYMQHGIVAWLSGPVDLLARRACQEDVATRPLLGQEAIAEGTNEQVEQTRKKLAEILEKRKEQYAQADMTVSLEDRSGNPLGAPVAVVAYRLLKALNERLKKDRKAQPKSETTSEFKGFGKRQ